MPPMKLWKFSVLMIPVLAQLSCSAPQVLEVRPLHLREIGGDEGDDPMIRGEHQRRMHGAISVAEQGQKLGYYYTVLWDGSSGSGPGEVVFEFQQGATGSRVKKMTHRIPAGEGSGKAEFAIIGEDYRKGGRVLAWRCKLIRDGREVASKQSYLWQ
jgi:hypothetical protein